MLSLREVSKKQFWDAEFKLTEKVETYCNYSNTLAEPPGDRERKVKEAIKLGYRRQPLTTQTEE